jgi:predicted RNA binding protein YcfA (HicA-like mRNA interferase family)
MKALERICTTPPASDITWKELKALLEGLGYGMLKGSGSRRKFYHQETKALIICHEPHPSPKVDKACVRDVAQHLRDYGFWKE